MDIFTTNMRRCEVSYIFIHLKADYNHSNTQKNIMQFLLMQLFFFKF